MKGIKSLFAAVSLLSFSVILLDGKITYADENSTMSHKSQVVHDRFSHLKDTDSLLVLPDGGFLHGEAIVTSRENPDQVVARYNSDNDPNAITVSQARKGIKENENKSDFYILDQLISPRATKPSGTVWGLSLGASYSSSAFSGSGWRFAGYLFKAINSAGPYLNWTSHVGSGVIGTETEAWNTYSSGYAIGEAIYAGGATRKSGTSTFYSYNPVNGTYYVVSNT
ncbi:hypothetical protein [Enterococcus hirae]|uniref:hypothetical protein n=1 Tax=Enterococcus hirae TaxID=1354 RepID=UPI0013788B12|nr:hypothetical protein [Enterococcus hirae]NBA39235.1 hypothetical protein [Enterococcus hirae]NBA55821.1 hypothetical protein [Enterococcus hirae]